jgi:hypothetical protein
LPDATCAAQATILGTSALADGSLVELEVRFVGGVPAGALTVILADSSGAPRGWAPVRSRKGQLLPGLLSSAAKELVRGFVHLPPGADSVVAVAVDASGVPLCRSVPMRVSGPP